MLSPELGGEHEAARFHYSSRRHSHDVAARDCFRLERVAGWGLHPLESAAFSRRTPRAVIRGQFCCDAQHGSLPITWKVVNLGMGEPMRDENLTRSARSNLDIKLV